MKKLLLFIMLVIIASPAIGEETADNIAMPSVKLYRVIDGDTVVFSSGDNLLTVRLIGVNAPESGELYSKTSTDYLREKLTDATIKLEKGEKPLDDYGRMLAYIWINGELLNAQILHDGAAAICFYAPNLRYADVLAAAQIEAITEKRGLWSVYNRSDIDASMEDVIIQYIGNIKSKALHKTSCTGLPAEKNRMYFDSYEDAISSGYHVCGICFR